MIAGCWPPYDNAPRIFAYGDRTRVLEDETTADSARLLETVVDENTQKELQVAVFAAVARLHWCRSPALPDDGGQTDHTI